MSAHITPASNPAPARPPGRAWRWWLIGAAAFVACFWAYDRSLLCYWVGSTDLAVEFLVTDAASGAPIPGARIEVRGGDGLAEPRRVEVCLTTDADGIASRTCLQQWCYGERSGLGITDTFNVRRPNWDYAVMADGYEPSKRLAIDDLPYPLDLRRSPENVTRMTVPIPLHRRGR